MITKLKMQLQNLGFAYAKNTIESFANKENQRFSSITISQTGGKL